ncbi:MAG: methyltransferase domain-containing protein [Deltaproteobacteria bacterium]|nr:methyltransferase domain-containing protein [Deltaproteobacteria bacterium]
MSPRARDQSLDPPDKGEEHQHELERFVPERDSALIAYEHVHRYALACALYGEGRILDLACGSGHGTRLLRDAGLEVFALDIDLTEARRAAPAICARAEGLPFADESFAGLVCFETIEHLKEPARLTAEMARVLEPHGVALISTPDRRVFTDRMGNDNPYHISEMDREELLARLQEDFEHVALYGQSVWAGSWIARLDDAGRPPSTQKRTFRLSSADIRDGGGALSAPWVGRDDEAPPVPMYLLAVCARQKKPFERALSKIGGDRLLHDPRQRLLGSHLDSQASLVMRDQEIDSQARHARNLEAALASRTAGLEAHIRDLDREVEFRDERIEGLKGHLSNLESELRERDLRVDGLEDHARNLGAELAERNDRVEHLETHAHQLDVELGKRDERVKCLEGHQANLEGELREHLERVAGLEAHVRNLEPELGVRAARVEALEEHIRNLDHLLDEARSHASNTEAIAAERLSQLSAIESESARSREELAREKERAEASEAALAEIRSTPWYRLLSRLGRVGPAE